jgi:hypothetical protein
VGGTSTWQLNVRKSSKSKVKCGKFFPEKLLVSFMPRLMEQEIEKNIAENQILVSLGCQISEDGESFPIS